MKKTLKVLGLLVVAAALFAGCKNNADEGSGEKNIQEALFDKADATKTATKVTYSDGAWVMRTINNIENPNVTKWVNAKELNYETKNNAFAETDFQYIESGLAVAKDTIDETSKTYAKAEGFTNFSDKEASYYRECNAEKFAELKDKYDGKSSSQIPEDELIDYKLYSNAETLLTVSVMLTYGHNFDEFKSNEDGTKYYGKYTEHNGSVSEYYIMKK